MAFRGAGAAGRAHAARRRADERVRRMIHESTVRLTAFAQGLRKRAGPSAAICASTRAGARAMPRITADMRRNWSRSRRTSCWRQTPRPFGHCCGRHVLTDRLRKFGRSGRRRPRRQPGAAGRTCHGVRRFRFRHEREMAGAPQADSPGVTRAAVLRDCHDDRRGRPIRRNSSRGAVVGGGINPIDVHDADEIERSIDAFARGPNGGLIVVSGHGRDFIASRSSHWRRGTACRRSTRSDCLPPTEA